MRERIRNYFSFTDSERKGTVVLLALIFLLLLFSFIRKQFYTTPQQAISISSTWIPVQDSSAEEPKEITQKEDDHEAIVMKDAAPHSLYHQHELFNFDPNGLPEDDWVRLGLSPAQARVMKNYEAKGGTFRSKADVKKMFVISEKFYNEIESYILLPTTAPAAPGLHSVTSGKLPTAPATATATATTTASSHSPVIVELNTADTTDLIAVKGIGPAFARRIVAYRERLGGFHSKEQLTEVFGIDAEKYAALKDQVKADSTYIRKININTAEISDLKKHPYFSPSVAAALVNYRKQHGPFRNLHDICNCALVSADLYRKIAPYLTI